MVLASELKEQGNAAYKKGDFSAAENLYTQAIAKGTRDHALFRNRALCRIKLEKWEGAEADARKAAELSGPRNDFTVKAYYYLTQALLGQQRPQEALNEGHRAYQLSLDIHSPNTEVLSQAVLKAKQMVWKHKEAWRLRGLSETLAKLEDLLDRDVEQNIEALAEKMRKGEMGETGYEEDKKVLLREVEERKDFLREAFAKAKGNDFAERVVPDYLVDAITFELMQDPVVTPSGHSFDRVNIVKHVESAGLDPLSRVKMTVRDLRPNYALKEACTEFLMKNGWAADW